MTLPEIGQVFVNERTGLLYLIFEPGRAVRIDEPFDIVNFNPQEWPEGFCPIVLPAETRRIIFDRYKAVKDTADDNKNE
jgi:hypothetical protein